MRGFTESGGGCCAGGEWEGCADNEVRRGSKPEMLEMERRAMLAEELARFLPQPLPGKFGKFGDRWSGDAGEPFGGRKSLGAEVSRYSTSSWYDDDCGKV